MVAGESTTTQRGVYIRTTGFTIRYVIISKTTRGWVARIAGISGISCISAISGINVTAVVIAGMGEINSKYDDED